MYLRVGLLLLLLLSPILASGWDNNVLWFNQELQQLLEPSNKPCRNFYQYVCANNVNFNQTQRRQQEQQRFQQLLKASKASDLLPAEQQLHNFYRSCETSRDVQSLRSSQLYRNTGGWPALQTAGNYSQSWLQLLAHFHEIGANYFFQTSISMQSNKRVVTLQPDATRRQTMSRFEQRLGELLHSFGVEQSRAHVIGLEVLSLERARRELLSRERNEDQSQFSYAQFRHNSFGNATLARLDWDAYFRQLLGGKTLRATDTIVVKQLPRLVNYMLLLQATSVQRLLNWMWIDYLMDIFTADCQQLVETYAGDLYVHLVLRVTGNRSALTQLYTDIGREYRTQLGGSVWIDEISEQASQQFLSQLMQLTVSGDDRLNATYNELQLGRRSFYGNLEQLRAFQQRRQPKIPGMQHLRQLAQGFQNLNTLLPQLNLSKPLTHLLLGEHFARTLISAGSSSHVPGAWRSVDSESQFAVFENCSNRLPPARNVNKEELLLAKLAQRLAWNTYKQWLAEQASPDALRLPRLRHNMTAERLHFVGSLLGECRAVQSTQQQETVRYLQRALLGDTPEFSAAFGCKPRNEFYVARERCKLKTNA